MGLFKKIGQRMTKRQEARQERKLLKAEAKANAKEIRAESKASKRIDKGAGKRYKKERIGDSILSLADQGIDARSNMLKGFFDGATKLSGTVGASIVGANAVKGLFGKGGNNDENNNNDTGGSYYQDGESYPYSNSGNSSDNTFGQSNGKEILQNPIVKYLLIGAGVLGALFGIKKIFFDKKKYK